MSACISTSPRSRAELDAVLVALVDRVTRRMRASRRAGRTVILRLRFRDYARVSRSRTLPYATDETSAILAAAKTLLAAEIPTVEARGITLLGVAVSNIAGDGCGVQLELPLDGRPSGAPLDAAIDEVRDRFGPDAIRRAGTLTRGSSFSPWLRPGDEAARS